MSTHIVDHIRAIRFDRPADSRCYLPGPLYLVLHIAGDSNCFSKQGRSRDWGACYFGPDWQVIGEVAKHSGACSGGMMKLYGRETTPEAYIRAHRKALAEAVDGLAGAARIGVRLEGRVTLFRNDGDRQFPRPHDAYSIDRLVAAGKPLTEDVWYGEPVARFAFNLSDPADMALWLDNIRPPVFNWAAVFGPDPYRAQPQAEMFAAEPVPALLGGAS